MKINIKILHEKLGKDWKMPTYMTSGSVGMDLVAAIDEEIILRPGKRCLVPSGFSIGLPPGYEVQVRPRSGLALKNGITVLNSPGTVDSDYRGQVGAILINLGNKVFSIKPGDRVAQMVINKVEIIDWSVVESLEDTIRGAGGFGSSGV